MAEEQSHELSLKAKIAKIIFGANTFAGRLFDIVLLWAILISVLEVMLESVNEFRDNYGQVLTYVEWFFTIIFTIEYLVRIWVSKHPLKYIFSFYGLVDLFSILPTYLGLFVSGSSYLRTIRIFRLLRVFRILKLVRYLSEADNLLRALMASSAKITVFLMGVVVVAIIVGTLMYIIEDAGSGFTSIPRSIYWAIVTVTTVGFGDITPQTVLGQTLASFLMIVGYGIIAVPTGIVSSEFTSLRREEVEKLDQKIKCQICRSEFEHGDNYCKTCGNKIAT